MMRYAPALGTRGNGYVRRLIHAPEEVAENRLSLGPRGLYCDQNRDLLTHHYFAVR